MPDEPGTPNPALGQNANELPEWARKAISDANSEAASKRVELRTKIDELTAANSKITEIGAEKDAAVKAKADAENALLKLTVALAAGIPGEKAAAVAERLKGVTEDELTADARSLVETFGTGDFETPPAIDLSQGQSGTNPSNNTPESDMALWLKKSFESLPGMRQ
jgi:hypothetical protein